MGGGGGRQVSQIRKLGWIKKTEGRKMGGRESQTMTEISRSYGLEKCIQWGNKAFLLCYYAAFIHHLHDQFMVQHFTNRWKQKKKKKKVID